MGQLPTVIMLVATLTVSIAPVSEFPAEDGIVDRDCHDQPKRRDITLAMAAKRSKNVEPQLNG